MAYIYCITNKINGKLYVGKTENTIDERWREHKADCIKKRCEKRPLYDAMLKYGIDNFEIKELEYLKEGGKLLSNRESFWIKKLNTFHNGYNATTGGDGTTLYDYNKIIKLYKDLRNIKQVSKKLGCSLDTIRNILNSNNIDIEKRKALQTPKQVELYSLNGEYLNSFNSYREAAFHIAKIQNKKFYTSMSTKISECTRGIRKSIYGYIWKNKEVD